LDRARNFEWTLPDHATRRSSAARAITIRDGMSGTKEQICVACGVVREQVSAEPVSRGYELRTLVCPNCRTVLRFVDKRPKRVPVTDGRYTKSYRVEIGLKAKAK
jgi:hypothetical protein